jgi:hypothetical protein
MVISREQRELRLFSRQQLLNRKPFILEPSRDKPGFAPAALGFLAQAAIRRSIK